MPAIYTEDCISFSSVFGTISTQKLVQPGDILAFRSHEAAAGMNVGEMYGKMDHPINLLHLTSERVRRAFDFTKLAFLPPPHIVTILQDLYAHNSKCPMSERRRFDEVPELQQDCEYILDMLPTFREDIFLKHPITGVVTMHRFPYGEMPRFRLRSAHPSLVSVAADDHIANWRPVHRAGHPIRILGQLRESIIWPPMHWVPPPIKKDIRRPATPRQRKQKARCDNVEPSSPKRARNTAAIPNPPQDVESSTCSPISSPDLHLRLKRKTCADTDTPVPPPTKRVRTQPAEAPAIAANGGSRVAGACRATRSVRASKTKAVARMAKVA